MTEPLILHELPPSPNNVRARLALKWIGRVMAFDR